MQLAIRRCLRHIVTSALAGLLASGCGSGGGGSDGPTTGTFPVNPTFDGYFRASDSNVVPNGGNGIAVGSNGSGYVDGFVRFSHPATLTSLPSTRIVSVVLHLTKVGTQGNPQADHPTVRLTHPDFGSGITYSDDSTGASAAVIQTFSTLVNGGVQPFTVDVTAQVKSDLSGGLGHSDFFLYSTALGSTSSYYQFQDSEQGVTPLSTNPGPFLLVTFQP